jgi:hypothetical protein
MPIYNVILYLSGAAALSAVAVENQTASRRVPMLVAAAAVPVLVRAQHGEFRSLLKQAARDPGWWNRRLQRRIRYNPTNHARDGFAEPYDHRSPTSGRSWL